MKKISVLFAIVATVMFNCIDGTDSWTEDNDPITQKISKVETSYVKGAEKIEGFIGKPKVETKLNGKELDELSSKINSAIASELSKLEDRYKTSRTIFDGYDVGVIPNVDACPSWSERIRIFMDCEDHNPETNWVNDGPGYQFVSVYRGAWNVSTNRNVAMVFCRVDGRLFQNFKHEHALLRLGTNYLGHGDQASVVVRHFDNEDKNNTNNFSGDIAPNISNKNTTLQFVTSGYTGGLNHWGAPDLGFGYGVIGYPLYNACPDPTDDLCGNAFEPYGVLHIDDEDSNNSNTLTRNGQSVTNVNRYLKVAGPSSTRIWIIKVR